MCSTEAIASTDTAAFTTTINIVQSVHNISISIARANSSGTYQFICLSDCSSDILKECSPIHLVAFKANGEANQ
jgi:hypothetical protein